MREEFVVNNSSVTLINGDCLNLMRDIESGSIDLIAIDPPYGTTQNKWDVVIPLEPMWEEFKRIIKRNGVVAITATQPFVSYLVISNIEMFKYDIVWRKTVGSGQLNIKHMPLRVHEHILIFYGHKPTYNEQLADGKSYEIVRSANYNPGCYGAQSRNSKINNGFRHAKSVVDIPNPRIKNGYPTQKPVELMEYIIKTYSNKGEFVLDCCMGSGTTGVACVNIDRNFIGMDNYEENLFRKTVARLKNKTLFVMEE
jgi:site-specific DNA-methyltransferase (adenine-specific)